MNQQPRSLLMVSLLSTVARFAGVGLNFAVAIILTRHLPMAEAGMVFMLMTLVTGVSLASRLGAEQWLVRDVARLPAEHGMVQVQYLRDGYRMVMVGSGIFMLAWMIFTPLMQHWLFDDLIKVDVLLLAGTGIVTFNLVMMNAAFLKAVRNTSSSLLVQNALPAISYMLLLLVFWQDFRREQHYLWLYVASLAVAGIASFYWLHPWWQHWRSSASPTLTIREVLRQSLPLAPVSFFSFLMLWADTLMTGWLLSNEEVALFTVAARLSFVSLFFLGALDATIYPRLLAIQQHQAARLPRFFWQATLLVAGVLGSVTLCLLLVGETLLNVFRPEYRQAVSALALLLIAQLARALSLTFSFMFIIRAQVRFLNGLLMAALLVNIVANGLLIPRYGIEGAAMATLIANAWMTAAVTLLFFYKRLLHEPQPAKQGTPC